MGFQEKNICALCDVGRTTKQQALGYIGQKGIGFKSVFKITDAPQIHSGGFHIAFDLGSNSSLGYILPTWLGGAPVVQSKLQLGPGSTQIVLPFKPQVRGCSRAAIHQSVLLSSSELLFHHVAHALVWSDKQTWRLEAALVCHAQADSPTMW